MTSLDDRIAAAFANDATSADFAPAGEGALSLLEAVEAASQAANETAERARERSLDPQLRAGEVNAAKREADAAAWQRDRLAAALPRLQTHLAELRAIEEDGRRRVTYAQVKTERDQLATELGEVYPKLVAQLVDLLDRLGSVDQRVSQANAALPSGEPALLLAELKGRGLRGFAGGYRTDILPLSRAVRLPNLGGQGFAWPPALVSEFDSSGLFNAMSNAFAQAERAKAEKQAKQRV